MALPYLPADKIERQFHRLQQQALPDPCMTSAVTSTKIGSVARPSRHRRGAFSWKLSGRTMTWKVGTMAWTAAPKDVRSCPFTSLSRYYTGKLAWSTCRSVWFQTKHSRGTSGRPTEPCREDSSISGSSMRTAKGIRKSFWRPVLTSFK